MSVIGHDWRCYEQLSRCISLRVGVPWRMPTLTGRAFNAGGTHGATFEPTPVRPIPTPTAGCRDCCHSSISSEWDPVAAGLSVGYRAACSQVSRVDLPVAQALVETSSSRPDSTSAQNLWTLGGC